MQKMIRKQGVVRSFNISPKGIYEGVLLEQNGQLIQINFAPDWASHMAQAAGIGETIDVEVLPFEAKDTSAHPIYHLTSFKPANSTTFHSHPPNGEEHFAGTITRLNYALHGEVNGGILDSGDFVHLKPHGAATVQLSVGMTVRGKGSAKPMTGGFRVIEAEEINGIRLEHKPKPKKKAPHR